MFTTGPTTWTALSLFEFFLCAPDSSCPCRDLFGIIDPTNEFVAGERCDVIPGLESRTIRNQGAPQVGGKFMDHATGYTSCVHP